MSNFETFLRAVMRRPQAWLLVLMAAGVFGTAAPRTASADVVEYNMANRTNYTVSLKFYSRSRNAVWPGARRVWVLLPQRRYTFRLRCFRGEKICYGAWPRGGSYRGYWGVYRGNRGCRTCCFRCGNGYVNKSIGY